jgi:hypothetical protein
VNVKPVVDLIIVDVPIVLDPENVVPLWNQSTESLLEAMFVFVEDYLQDDSAIIVIHLY